MLTTAGLAFATAVTIAVRRDVVTAFWCSLFAEFRAVGTPTKCTNKYRRQTQEQQDNTTIVTT